MRPLSISFTAQVACAIALVPAAEVQHQITGVIALDRELEGIDRAAPDPFLGIGRLPALLGDVVVKELLKDMGRDDRRLVLIHLIELMGLDRAALEGLGIKHVPRSQIFHQGQQCVVHRFRVPALMVNPAAPAVQGCCMQIQASSPTWSECGWSWMRRLLSLAGISLALALSGCGGSSPKTTASGAPAITAPITIELDQNIPAKSQGVMVRGDERTTFQVGFGRLGVTCAKTRFEEGYTPLGSFKVNAILSKDRFEMDPKLIAQSGKSKAELKETLFKNMNTIDFKGDGEVGEYGIGYISLEPIDSVKQPFAFNTYDGKFRWYSFAIHGSNNEQRIGEQVTGGCLNVSEPTLKAMLASVQLGDQVEVKTDGPCTP